MATARANTSASVRATVLCMFTQHMGAPASRPRSQAFGQQDRRDFDDLLEETAAWARAQGLSVALRSAVTRELYTAIGESFPPDVAGDLMKRVGHALIRAGIENS